MPRRIVMFSGGRASWAAAKRDALLHGTRDTTLLFADTRMEDADTYRFLEAAAQDVGAPLVKIADGRTIWEVFRDNRMIGNTRADLCSRILKRDLCDHWLKEHCDPQDTVVVLGLHIEEVQRFRRASLRYRELGWTAVAPLCDKPYQSAIEISDAVRAAGLPDQRLYQLGFPHANCGGGCVKAGQAHFLRLLQSLPEVFAEWERQEEALRSHIGKNVSILRDRQGGRTTPLPLRRLRLRHQAGYGCDPFDTAGGCGCFSD